MKRNSAIRIRHSEFGGFHIRHLARLTLHASRLTSLLLADGCFK